MTQPSLIVPPSFNVPLLDDQTITHLFEKQAVKSWQTIALISSQKTLTFQQLHERSNQLAHTLRQKGVGPESLVALLIERSPDMVIAILAIMKAGGAFLPLDLSFPQERIEWILKESMPQVVLTDQKRKGSLQSYPGHLLDLASCYDTNISDLAPFHTPQNLAYVIYTSGSTGKPKGVMIEHASLWNYLDFCCQYYPFAEGAALFHTSIAFDLSLTSIFLPLIKGHAIYLMPENSTISDLARVLQEQPNIRFLKMTPAHLRALKHFIPNPPRLNHPITVVIGGEMLLREDLKNWLRGDSCFTFFNEYGPTEATVGCSVFRIHPEEETSSISFPIGEAIPRTKLYLLDSQQRTVHGQETGELYIGGLGLARGYLKNEQLTKEKFVLISLDPGISTETNNPTRLYRTGDLARLLPNGSLEFLGRIDDQVKIRGYRIELGEIESVLKKHGDVADSCVIAYEEATGQKSLIAYFVAGEFAPSETELREYLARKLPTYMIPTYFIPLIQIPLTTHGKIDRKKLPLPSISSHSKNETATALNPTQAALVQIWTEVLKIKEIGLHDNFFRIGGDSIISLQMISKARQKGYHFNIQDLFAYPTIAELAPHVKKQELISIKPTPADTSQDIGLSPIQKLFFSLDMENKNHFNQAVLLDVCQKIEIQILNSAFSFLESHHKELRIRFYRDSSGEWKQYYAATENTPICMYAGVAESENWQKRVEEESRALHESLDIEKGPVIRAILFEDLQHNIQKLLIIVHHLLIDGVSWRILVEDLSQVYFQLTLGNNPSLPFPTHSFQQWTDCLKSYSSSQELLKEAVYWKKIGASIQHLGLEEAFIPVLEKETCQQTVFLSKRDTFRLLHSSHQAFRTQINDLLLTALVLAFGDWTKNYALTIALEGHGREGTLFPEMDISRTLGWFTSIFPAHLMIEDPNDLAKSIKTIKETLRLIPHKGVGYGVLTQWTKAFAPYTLQINFNYLGQWDIFSTENGIFRYLDEFYSQEMAKTNRRFFPLEITGEVKKGILSFHWKYSSSHYRASTIGCLSRLYIERLQQLIEYCHQPSHFGYTPSDFPLATLSPKKLDENFGSIPHIVDIYPLSAMQRGILTQSLLYPDADTYFVQMVFTLEGKIDVQALEAACQKITSAHCILRTGFIWNHLDRPLQYVLESVVTPFRYLDFRPLNGMEQKARLKQLLSEDRKKGFDISHPPLQRFYLICQQDHYYTLIWSHHHILLDGWSSSLLLEELFRAYAQLKRGDLFSPLPRQKYRDFIQRLEQHDCSPDQVYWQEYLKTVEEGSRLSFHSILEKDLSKDYATYTFNLTTEEMAQILTFTQQNHITVNTLLQGALGLVLQSYLNQKEIIFGVTISGRNLDISDIEQMVGLFINTVPLKVSLESFADIYSYLRSLQYQTATHQDHALIPLSDIQSWSTPHRHLFNVIFVFEKYPFDLNDLFSLDPGFLISEMTSLEKTEYALTVAALLTKSQIQLILHYQTSHFNEKLIQRLSEHLRLALHEIIHHPHQQPCNICILTPQERKTILDKWKGETQRPIATPHFLEIFEAQVQKTPHATALIFGEKRLTYAQLNGQANQWAHLLREKGVEPESLVAIACERSLEMVTGLIGIWKVGGAYVPLDLSSPPERLVYMLEEAQPICILANSSFSAQFPEKDYLFLHSSTIQTYPNDPSSSPVFPSHLAYVIYTSGSTGKPKGVMIEHQSLSARLASLQDTHPLQTSDCVLHHTSLSFDVSIEELFWPLSQGCPVVIAPPQIHQDIEHFDRLVCEEQITILQFVPSFLRLYLDHLTPSVPRSLKTVFVGGEALSHDLVETFYHQFPKVKLLNAYGPTEATVDATHFDCAEWRRFSTCPFVPIGRPLPETEVFILDGHLKPLPVGVAGELYLGGKGIARGYFRQLELTQEKFIPHPFTSEYSRLYRTGDICRWQEDGTIEFLGRIDSQVKVRGIRIELAEIEAALLEHPSILQAVVIQTKEAQKDTRLIGYLVMSQPSTASEIQQFLKEKLPTPAIPNSWIFLDRLPLTPQGKIDRLHLPEANSSNTIVPPCTSIESQLYQIWQKILKVEAFGVQDNFFELGGHSISATRLLFEVKKAFDCSIPLSDFFNYPTIAYLASILERESNLAPLTPILDMIRSDLQDGFQIKRLDASAANTCDPQQPSGIFLTGATGFLGVHLLEQLLKASSSEIYCLLRGESEEAAVENLHKSLDFYQLGHLKTHPRLKPLRGDLAQPSFGLTPELFSLLSLKVDALYLNGAHVHHLYDYSRLRAPNVLSVIETLKFSSIGCPKRIHFISTLSSSFDRDTCGNIPEEFVRKFPQGHEGGYTLSKWAGEKILADAIKRGFNVTIYRLPQLMGGLHSHLMPTDRMHIALLMKTWVQWKVAPDNLSLFHMLPVDFAAEAIVKLSYMKRSINQTLNLTHPCPPTYSQIIGWLNNYGFPIKRVDLEEWQQKCLNRIQERDALYPLLSLYQGNFSNQEEEITNYYRQDTPLLRTTQSLLQELEHPFPSLTKELFYYYFDFLKPWLKE